MKIGLFFENGCSLCNILGPKLTPSLYISQTGYHSGNLTIWGAQNCVKMGLNGVYFTVKTSYFHFFQSAIGRKADWPVRPCLMMTQDRGMALNGPKSAPIFNICLGCDLPAQIPQGAHLETLHRAPFSLPVSLCLPPWLARR